MHFRERRLVPRQKSLERLLCRLLAVKQGAPQRDGRDQQRCRCQILRGSQEPCAGLIRQKQVRSHTPASLPAPPWPEASSAHARICRRSRRGARARRQRARRRPAACRRLHRCEKPSPEWRPEPPRENRSRCPGRRHLVLPSQIGRCEPVARTRPAAGLSLQSSPVWSCSVPLSFQSSLSEAYTSPSCARMHKAEPYATPLANSIVSLPTPSLGRRMMKRVPLPGVLSTSILPLCALTIQATKLRPRPCSGLGAVPWPGTR